VIAALLLLASTSLLSFLAGRRPRLAAHVAALGTAAAAVPLLRDAVSTILGSAEVSARLPLFALPGGGFRLALDPLSALFLLPVALLAPLAAIHGSAGARRPALLPLLALGLVLVAAARHAILFLIAWEGMSLAAFLLLASGHERDEVRRGSRVFLVAGQLGGACLLAFFALLGAGADLDYASLAEAGARASPALRGALAALAIAGFGTKLGIVPFHSWAPAAYPAAPGHVAALLSGAMSKMGAYGLLRAALLLGTPPAGMGAALLGLGALSALAGIAFAVGQRDLKRALAWSSVENGGIVALGAGLAILARAGGSEEVALLAAAGALLHLLHHAAMKGLLFLGAASIEEATGRTDLEGLGGLLRRMPGTGAAFLAGSAAIAAIPPLCGFVGEWLLLHALLRAAAAWGVAGSVAALLALLSLAAAGGLAAATFLRIFSVAFLGTPRSEGAEKARETGIGRAVPLLLLALFCLTFGLLPQRTIRLVLPAAAAVAGIDAPAPLAGAVDSAARVGQAAALLLGLAALLLLLRRALARGLPAQAATWGCGYARPGPRMQYTASSFAAGLVRAFSALLLPRVESTRASGRFAAPPFSRTEIPDRVERGLLLPLFAWFERRLAPIRRFQDGRINRYLLQMALLVVVALVWAVVSPLVLRH